tara:strand:- start:2514 stop:2861 length:348 start_codon:yes stop_codon:yes gene_type:complete
MPNDFKIITRNPVPAAAGTPDTIYTVQTGSTLVVQKITLCNIHTTQVTASVQVVSTTAHTGQTANQTADIIKDVPIPSGSTFVLDKMNLNVGDVLQVDCSIADKLSVTMHYMEQT